MTAVIVTGVVNLQLAIVLSRRISIVNADPARSVRVEPSLFIAGASQLSVAVPVVVRPTATENCPVEALVVPSVTLMLMFSYTPTSAVLGVPYSHPVDLETAARYLYEVANHSNHPKAWRNLGMVYGTTRRWKSFARSRMRPARITALAR